MTTKEKAVAFLCEYNLGNPNADLLIHLVAQKTGLSFEAVLYRIRGLADG